MKQYDAIILGAGINGCGIARELSNKGKKVLVIDKSTIGSGTSSKSSRLIHGGLRYLENFDFSLVKESLQDRNRLVDIYPNLVKMRRFYLPVMKKSKRFLFAIKLGLKIYDFLSADERYKSGKISKNEFDNVSRLFRGNLSKKIFFYYDAVTDDKKLTEKIALEARAEGVEFLENYQIEAVKISKQEIIVDNKYKASILINATGPWINELCDRYNLPASYKINKVSGIHIEIDKELSREPMILETQNKRIFFVIPNGKSTIIGTTEREESRNCDEVEINQDDIDYLVNLIKYYFEIDNFEIINSWIGIRPLIESKSDLGKITRDYIFDLHEIDGVKVLNVFGGKLTTFNSLSQKVYNKLKKECKW